MINVLEFDMDINYKYAWNIAARSVYYLNDHLDDCMILYKYNLADGYIWTKFGTGDPDKIDFEKLIGRSLIIFHSDVFKEKTDRFEDLLIFCQERGIDVYIPLPRHIQTHLLKMREIIDKFDHIRYDFTEMIYNKDTEVNGIIINRLKPLIRQIKLNKLL
jgi:hypothetical protein